MLSCRSFPLPASTVYGKTSNYSVSSNVLLLFKQAVKRVLVFLKGDILPAVLRSEKKGASLLMEEPEI